ncbi:MAG: hypothetical protein IJI59_13565, partial [Clostridia bacterium]|nr:hypothetical protein [Clostridia bacterium]
MDKKKHRKKKGLLSSRFYRIYFTVVAVAVVAIAIGLMWLRGAVADYEIAQPVHAAEEVAALFEEGDWDRIHDLDTSAKDISGGDKALYVQQLTELTDDGDIAWSQAFSSNPDEMKYTVTLDDDKLATFTLVPSGQTTGHGNRLWKLGTITTHVAVEGTEAAAAGDLSVAPYRVKAPTGYTVSVNGRELTDADAMSTGEAIFQADFLPEGINPPTMTEYAFFSDEGAPVLSAKDAAGKDAEVQPDGDNRWVCPLKEDTEFASQYSDAIIALAERVAKYTVKDLSRNGIMKDVAGESPAESILKKFSNDWAPPHKTATVTDAKVTDFYVLSDDCFTCHVEFTFTLRTRRGNDYVYPTSYTFCVVRRKGTGKLYNLTFN